MPTFVGVLLPICAVLALKPRLHRHGIHAAMVVALPGAAGPLMNVGKLGELVAGTAERPLAIVRGTIMFLLLAFLSAMGVRSFIAARRTPPPTRAPEPRWPPTRPMTQGVSGASIGTGVWLGAGTRNFPGASSSAAPKSTR